VALGGFGKLKTEGKPRRAGELEAALRARDVAGEGATTM
jgi:hypothetical protein